MLTINSLEELKVPRDILTDGLWGTCWQRVKPFETGQFANSSSTVGELGQAGIPPPDGQQDLGIFLIFLIFS